MSNTKNTSSKKQGKSSTSNDYKYVPGADSPKSSASENKRPSSGNVRGV